jgi:hypothetical protein
VRELPHLLKGIGERPIKLLSDPIESPAIVLTILDPFKVTSRHTAGIGQDVGQDNDAAFIEDFIRVGIGRSVGAFDNDRGLYTGRILGGAGIKRSTSNSNISPRRVSWSAPLYPANELRFARA